VLVISDLNYIIFAGIHFDLSLRLFFVLLEGPNKFLVLPKCSLYRFVSCLNCLSTLHALLKLLNMNRSYGHLCCRCWVVLLSIGLSQVCSSSFPMASWISPLFSRKYSCGLHGNMLRLHGNMLEYFGNSMEIFWKQMLMGHDQKRLEWNYLWPQLISYLGGSLVLFCPYFFDLMR